ncbi:MAG: hypothetical protein DPW18_08525 [Chloroflexi bacterium]|nr:hypothetical protein [Chloroflexota bacterium]MDL1941819.1 hypothetical protein [Chloroflexi bacterium CFX2]
MMKKVLPILAALALFLAACGQPAAPTMSSEEVQGTAVAAAWTMVAMTQASIPTATPPPPTETPSPTSLPTFTPPALPSPTIAIAPPTATSKPAGECEGPLNVAEAGPQSSVRIENDTNGTVTLSLHLSKNLHGQCGFLTYYLGKKEKLTVSIPKGEYFAFALIAYSDGSSGNASGYINNRVGDNHLFVVKIKPEVIVVP